VTVPHTVTITGADDRTSVREMVGLSIAHPFLEWGVLVSRTREGQPRFPSAPWRMALARAKQQFTDVRVSVHVCGEWAQQAVRGELTLRAFGRTYEMADRVQLNTNEPVTRAGCAMLSEAQRRIIVQVRELESLEAAFMLGAGVDAATLFDASGGRGITPARWPHPMRVAGADVPAGYAGGIGPDNIQDAVRHASAASDGRPYWLDMETGVREGDALDLGKTGAVLRAVAEMGSW